MPPFRVVALTLLPPILMTVCGVPAGAKQEFQLPPDVTPAILAACETDVRRLCIGENPTEDKVKACVMQKFFKLNKQCQLKLVAAGFAP